MAPNSKPGASEISPELIQTLLYCCLHLNWRVHLVILAMYPSELSGSMVLRINRQFLKLVLETLLSATGLPYVHIPQPSVAPAASSASHQAPVLIRLLLL